MTSAQSSSSTPDNVIFLPNEIENETCQQLTSLILRQLNKPIYIFCRGDGGSSRATVGIIDAINYHSNVTIFLTSEANSAHSMIFAACPHRYTFPYGRLGVHEAGWYDAESLNIDARYARFLAEDFTYFNDLAVQLYTRASNKSQTFWKRTLKRAAVNQLAYFSSDKLITMGMAQPISAFPRKMMEKLW
jgi:ATP-dependent protease ClpP protease subunit